MSSDIDFRPSGPVRPGSIYTSWRLYKTLGYIARKTGQSREDLAELVLNDWMLAQHPEIVKWMNQREDEETEFLKKLKP